MVLPISDPSPRRAVCPVCARAASACICRWITPTAHAAEVLVLQHPLEVANAKNTARLLHLSLARSRLCVGETFDDAQWLAAPWREGDLPRRLVLLYPDDGTHEEQRAEPVASTSAGDPTNLRLVVLDATWRKSRKMLHRSPALRQLPRLALHGLPASAYRIRKAHRPDQLSTLEATCAALAQLEEGGAAQVARLLAAFDGFVAQQAAYRPA